MKDSTNQNSWETARLLVFDGIFSPSLGGSDFRFRGRFSILLRARLCCARLRCALTAPEEKPDGHAGARGDLLRRAGSREVSISLRGTYWAGRRVETFRRLVLGSIEVAVCK